MTLIQSIEKEVEEKCKSENNIFGYGIWTHHILSVVKYSKILATKLNADLEIVEISALLHDYASIKDKNMYEDHHIFSGEEAEKILKQFNYPQNKINHVKECIYSHRGSINKEKISKEAVCVADADAMAHIDNVPSLLYLAYCNHNLSIDEGSKWVSEKLKRSWNKLSDEAKEIIEKKYNNAQEILIINNF
jgi:uncharacterized protein